MVDCKPSSYPSHCTISAEELRAVRDAVTNSEQPLGEKVDGEWPPKDSTGKVYPIFFTLAEIDDRGKLRDSNDTRFSPFQGNLQPRSGDDWSFCNAPLNNWRDRYLDVRYCGCVTPPSDTYCSTHDNRKHTMKTAEEMMQTGLYTETIDHFYARLDPWKRLVGWGTYESLLGESAYEFGTEYREQTFDFTDSEFVPEAADENGELTVKCGYPTQHLDPSLSLFVASMMSVQMIQVQPTIMAEDEDGEGMMEEKQVTNAQLRSPTESNPDQYWKTIESWQEHHLNIPFSRLVSDHPRLLERGGVDTDPESESDGVSGDDIVLEIDADPDGVETTDDGTDPNVFADEDYESPSERITASVEDTP